MKTNKELFMVSTLTRAVQAALVVMFAIPSLAFADDDEVTALTKPTNAVEIGVVSTSQDSAKFGEYNGLNKSGSNLVGNLGIRGGTAYDNEGGTKRWSIMGSDLGLTSESLGANFSEQGQWSLGFGYDELRHNISNTFQTPLIGSMGGNSFTVPSTFGLINPAYQNTATFKQGAQALTGPQQALFQTQDVHSDRKNTSLSAEYNIDRQMSVKFDYNHLEQTGAKLLWSGTDASTLTAAGGGTFFREMIIPLMNPTNYTTDTFNLAFNRVGDKGFVNLNYFGSFVRDGYNSLSYQNPFANGTATVPANGAALGTPPTNVMSTAPANDFHQINLTGGRTLTPATKLSGGFSYGFNTQNDNYSNSGVMQTGGTPQSSLNGKVNTTHADVKLTNQASKSLVLTAGLKYNERDNRSDSYTYKFVDIAGANETAVNTPMSNRKTQAELAGDYRIDKSQRLHLGYEYEAIARWCNNALANTTQGVTPSYVSSSCAQMPQSREDKLALGYKAKAGETVDFNAGYSYAKRVANVQNFYNPNQANSQGYENFGYRAFFDASRAEQMLKAGANWQANDRLTFGLNGRYVDDKYDESTLGVQNGTGWGVNLDATYSYSDNGVVSAYLSEQTRKRDLYNANLRNALAPLPNIWSNQLNDKDDTLGITVKHKGLMAGKLDLIGDLSYTVSTTGYTNTVPYLATCGATTTLSCGSTPNITSEGTRLKLTGIYQVAKSSKVILGYMYQQLNAADYYYNFYQTGFTGTGNLSTNEQAPNYIVNVVTMAYVYNF